MEKKTQRTAHILAVPYPSQGHINPMLQFCKQLTSQGGVKTTFAITNFISKSLKPGQCHPSINIDTISDGYDDGGFSQANSISSYISALKTAGSASLAELIEKYSSTHEHTPITCVVYDSFLPWALEVARNYGLVGAAFFTQSCAVDYIYYHLYHGSVRLPPVISSSSSEPRVCIPGLPPLEIRDMPGFVGAPEAYPAYFELVLRQWSNLNAADFLLINTYYELEPEVVNSMSALLPNPVLTIGPTVPSTNQKSQPDQQHEDRAYGLDLFRPETPAPIIQWLNTKPPRSVIYASFGSMSSLTQNQMMELAYGLKSANYPFLWVVRSSEMSKLPGMLLEEITAMEKEEGEEERRCLIVPWISQVEVLAHESIGCFLSHCGWNSCVEALSLGVPMVAMPQWTDQPTDAKFVEDVWKVGVRVKVDDEKGWVGREEVEACLKEVMEGERSDEMRKNARKWSDLAKQSIRPGGSTYKNIDRFVSACVTAASNDSLNQQDI